MLKRAIFIAAVWLNLALPAFAAPAKVQDCAADQVGATTTSCTLASSVTVGDMLVVQVRTGCNPITSVVDNNTNTYQVATALQAGPGMAYYWVPTVPTGKGGSTTVTLTVPATSCNAGLIVSEWSGMGTLPVIDGTFANTTFTPTQTQIKTGTLSATGTNNEVLIGFGSTDSVQTPSGLIDYGTGGGTPTAFAHQGQSGSQTIVAAYQLSSTPASYGHQWTVTSSSISGMIMGFIPTPTITSQAIGPNGPGGICEYAPVSLANLSLYVSPAGTTCTTIVQNVATCVAGSAPTGSGSLSCAVNWNGSAWVAY